MKPALTIYVIKCIFSFWEFGGLFGAVGRPYWASFGLVGPTGVIKKAHWSVSSIFSWCFVELMGS